MGYASKKENIILCVSVLESVLGEMNAPINKGTTVDAIIHSWE